MSDPKKIEIRTVCTDGNSIDVPIRYDEQWGVRIGEQPFFKKEPKYPPGGRPWTNAVCNECPHYGGQKYNDCGTRPHFPKQNPVNLIGVCFHNELKQKEADRT